MEKNESLEEAEMDLFAAVNESWRSDVLTEWERTCSPPQSEEVCLQPVINGLHLMF